MDEMRRFWLGLCLLLMNLLLVAPLRAQMSNPLIVDVNANLNALDMQVAARPLVERGLQVVLIFETHGNQDVDAKLATLGIGVGGLVPDNLLAVYVSLEPRYAEIRYGDSLRSALGGDVADQIRLNTLNPQLRERQFNRAFIDTLSAIENAIQSGGLNANSDSEGDFLWWCLPVILLLILYNPLARLLNSFGLPLPLLPVVKRSHASGDYHTWTDSSGGDGGSSGGSW
jgi:hypothetical protein